MERSLSLELTKKMASTSSSFLTSISPFPNLYLRGGIVSLDGLHHPNLPKPILLMKSLPSSRFSSISSSSICCLKGQSDPMPVLSTSSSEPEVCTGMWNWQGYRIRYQYVGKSGPALVLVHGFGANSDHWQKNISVLAKSHRVYAIDLVGFGYSNKPNPRKPGMNSIYTFETWASQLNEFCADVVKDVPFFICNSIGGVVGLQAAVMEPQLCKGILLLNISLRMLHIKKQPWYARPLFRPFQSLLRNTAVGKMFYNVVATPDSVRSILCQVFLLKH